MSAYAELLKDPRWQRRRLEIMDRDGFSCTKCGESSKTLHVHHRQYRSGAMPWDYADEDLTTLCEPCHSAVSAANAFARAAINRLPTLCQWYAGGFAVGIRIGLCFESNIPGPLTQDEVSALADHDPTAMGLGVALGLPWKETRDMVLVDPCDTRDALRSLGFTQLPTDTRRKEGPQ